MKLETVLQRFDQFADAPNAVEAFRDVVLQLTVRGNLTETANGESCKSELKRADDFRVRRGRQFKQSPRAPRLLQIRALGVF